MSAREDIAYLLWTAVPSSDNDEAKARTQELLDAYRAEVLREVYGAIEDPAQRAAVGGGLGWETARDVVRNLLRKAMGGAR